MGYRHLKAFIDNKDILLGILQHHERLDDSGYNHIKAADISDFGKVIAVADVFSAMTTVRPYKTAMSCSTALQEMSYANEFDYNLVNSLKVMYTDGEIGKDML